MALTIVQYVVSATRAFESIAEKMSTKDKPTKTYKNCHCDNPDLELQLPRTASVGDSTPTCDENEVKMNQTRKCLTRYQYKGNLQL